VSEGLIQGCYTVVASRRRRRRRRRRRVEP